MREVLLLHMLAGSGDLLSVVLVAAAAVVVVAILTRGKWYLIVVFICSSLTIGDVECCATCLYYWQSDCSDLLLMLYWDVCFLSITF